MYLDHPITGVGTRNYGINSPLYEDEDRVKHGFHTWGTAGLLIFLYLLRWCFAAQRRLRRDFLARPDDPERKSLMLLGTGLAAGMVGFLVSGTFLTVLYYPVFWVLVGLFAALDGVANETRVAAVATGARR